MSATMERVAGAILLAAVAGQAAVAQTAQQLDWCNAKNNPSADLRIGGCTAIIQSGKYTGVNLAKAFVLRGKAYSAKDEVDKALADFSQAIKLDQNNSDAFT